MFQVRWVPLQQTCPVAGTSLCESQSLMIYIKIYKLFWLFQNTKITIYSWEYSGDKIG